MITIKTEELKKFLNRSSTIRPNPVYPSLDTIKIFAAEDKINFTKTNYNIFCTYSYDQFQPEEESFLIPERSLIGALAITKSESITIERKESAIFIVADGDTVMKAQWQEVGEFPVTPKMSNNQAFLLDSESITAIRIASKYISDVALKTAANFVNIGAGGIFGTNQAIMYHYKRSGLPTFFLDAEILAILGSIETAEYMTGENYDFFFLPDGILFAFVKTECKPIAYEKILAQPIEQYFVLNRQDIIDFCTAVEYTTKQELPLGRIEHEPGNGMMRLVYNDADFNDGVSKKISHTANFAPPVFEFNVKQIGNIMRNLPYEDIIFSKMGDHYKLSAVDDENYTGLIAGMAK